MSTQPMHEASWARGPPAADERDAGGDESDRDGEASDPGDPAEQRLDAPPERPGEVQVHRQGEQHSGDDEPDADELVLPTLRPRRGGRSSAAFEPARRCPEEARVRAVGRSWWTAAPTRARPDSRWDLPFDGPQVVTPSRYQRGVAGRLQHRPGSLTPP